MKACARFPLLSGDLLLGTLSFASRSKDDLPPDKQELIETIYHYVATAYERLRLVQNLRHADHQKDEFLATLAHDCATRWPRSATACNSCGWRAASRDRRAGPHDDGPAVDAVGAAGR